MKKEVAVQENGDSPQGALPREGGKWGQSPEGKWGQSPGCSKTMFTFSIGNMEKVDAQFTRFALLV